MCRPSFTPTQGAVVETDFQRIRRLPPYVFNIVGEMKAAARARGEDIIDFSMGNPDQPTPKHIVVKLTETAHRGDTHRYCPLYTFPLPRDRQTPRLPSSSYNTY